uniref:Uncharacterized protein n=1 Tax=Cucumis sativus TaxID=3659 RepID=A0A0A0LY58_CUCSA
MITRCLAGNLNGFHICFLPIRLRNHHSKNSVLHRCPNFLRFHILRHSKSPLKLSTASFYPMPFLVLILFLYVPFAANLNHSSVFNLHFHLLFLQSRQIGFQNMSLRRLLPIYMSVHYS